MRKLILLRHAKAEPAGAADDHNRRLVDTGRSAATEAGRWLADRGLRPDLVVCSTAARTRGTWDEVEAVLDSDIGVMFDDRLYDAEIDAVLEVLAETDAETGEVMIVGHNPSLESLVPLLTGADEMEALPTAGIRVIEFDTGDWAQIAGRGRLSGSFTPGRS